jgi:ABC-2 type transport system permease protein
MTGALVRKLLRDLRLPLFVVCLLLAGFQCFWARITYRVTQEVLPELKSHGIPLKILLDIAFRGPGKIVQTIVGGDMVRFDQPLDLMSIGYAHPMVLTILCVWAVGRAAWAIAGEIDRGTMELLLAQPLARWRVVLAHLIVDAVVLPTVAMSLWAGTWLGIAVFGVVDFAAPPTAEAMHVNPLLFFPAVLNAAAFLFAVSGVTMWLSAMGRFRGRVLGVAILVVIVQFAMNVVGQMLPALGFLRLFTLFYYLTPQQLILTGKWTVAWGAVQVPGVAVLATVGCAGYALALWTFCRRDLPAPL